METIKIYTSKKKSILLLLGCLVFVAGGIWLVMEADNLTSFRLRSPLLRRGIGIANILFFGFGVFVSINRLVKSQISLIIDPIGLDINPKKSKAALIKWIEIIDK